MLNSACVYFFYATNKKLPRNNFFNIVIRLLKLPKNKEVALKILHCTRRCNTVKLHLTLNRILLIASKIYLLNAYYFLIPALAIWPLPNLKLILLNNKKFETNLNSIALTLELPVMSLPTHVNLNFWWRWPQRFKQFFLGTHSWLFFWHT